MHNDEHLNIVNFKAGSAALKIQNSVINWKFKVLFWRLIRWYMGGLTDRWMDE